MTADPRVPADRRGPLRGARRPEPAGDRRAARGPRGRRSIGRRARRRAADQPAGRLPPPAAAEVRRSRRRGAARHAPDLPAPRRGPRGGPRLSRTRLGRGGQPLSPRRRQRDTASRVRARRAPRDRADPPRLRGRLPAGSRLRGLDRGDRPVVAGRPHGDRHGRPHRRPRAAGGRPDLRADAGRDRARLGRGDRLGAAAPARLPVAPPPGSRRRDRGRGPLRARGRRPDPGRDRASRLGGARRRRPEPGETAIRAAGRRSCRGSSNGRRPRPAPDPPSGGPAGPSGTSG